ncbi:alpha/beta hydrolase [Oceanotoga sp. DSM 15011]|uniref:Alpha/beta hydrolase n=1 Tax=Oceanotoga teriensis TaxID=515440 RepID=A0AA45C9E9_9BACT|nr:MULTISPECIES: alpha/beta hydrolase [Oceanotoga]MDN5342949.1 hypothetical protein [Oceanotoga sp.]MDO7975320.1 alpha/beta hydrolase [Oceanotoga teriensis]PWJ96652.1 hypothetical protein C7380_101226 [Oceanotoga teriensis]UYP00177.1 alpha/beta hydrolase [Oceanotoga sp. DSM 15011]
MKRNIDFNYERKKIDFMSGYIFKGRHYRCNYIRYKSMYKNISKGTETVEVYNFEPKDKVYASVLIVHGLGSSNIKFLLWMGRHLASVGINSSVLILPGNYTRVDDKSVSGRNYLWPDINIMYNFWENGILDIRTTLDLLEDHGLWNKNNALIGYCLGGMLSTIVSSIDSRISELILLTTGGHLPEIMYRSPATKFIRKLIEKGFKMENHLNEPQKMFSIYNENLDSIKKMTLDEIINSDIHPIFKIDPLSYAHLIDYKKVTFFEALFDKTLSIKSRKSLLKEFKGCKYYPIPIGHVSWLPFEYFVAIYIMNKLNIKDAKIRSRILTKDEMDENFDNIYK